MENTLTPQEKLLIDKFRNMNAKDQGILYTIFDMSANTLQDYLKSFWEARDGDNSEDEEDTPFTREEFNEQLVREGINPNSMEGIERLRGFLEANPSGLPPSRANS